MNSFKVVRLTDEDILTDSEWLIIYMTSFPDEEKEPVEVILKSILFDGLVYGLKDTWNTTKGIATVQILKNCRAIFLVYFAIEKDIQCKGIGTYFFSEIVKDLKKHTQENNLIFDFMVWEVEKPELFKDENDKLVKNQRLNFFYKIGGSLLTEQYFQPPLNNSAVVPMNLMVLPINVTDHLNTRKIIESIYFDKYARLNGIDEHLLIDLLNKVSSK